MASLIDWDLAARSAKSLSPAPPQVSADEADQVVAELYRSAEVAAAHVAELTQLTEPAVTALTRVVDRAGWIDVNAAGLRVDASDFRLWVCVHEVTHRVQFTAIPWLRQHMLDEVAALSESIETDPAALRERTRAALGELVKG